MTLGFRTPTGNASIVLGKLSGFNLWNYSIKAEEILRMSHGCGGEAGNVKAWETVRKAVKKEVALKWLRSCRDRKGKLSIEFEFPRLRNVSCGLFFRLRTISATIKLSFSSYVSPRFQSETRS